MQHDPGGIRLSFCFWIRFWIVAVLVLAPASGFCSAGTVQQDKVSCEQTQIKKPKTKGSVNVGRSPKLSAKFQKPHVQARKDCCPEKRKAENITVSLVDQKNDRYDTNGDGEFNHAGFPNILAGTLILKIQSARTHAGAVT